MAFKYVDDDFVAVRRAADSRMTPFEKLYFGDKVELIGGELAGGWQEVRLADRYDGSLHGFIRSKAVLRDDSVVLRFSMVDVQQGDGAVLETPDGQVVLIDGGEHALFARHVASRFRHRTKDGDPLDVAAIVISHGDADHFAGLTEIRSSESEPGLPADKVLPIRLRRLFTNGLVKGSEKSPQGAKRAETERLGATKEAGGRLYCTDLYDDPRDAPAAARDGEFTRFTEALDHWATRGAIECRRVDASMDPDDLFDFLVDEGVHVELLGPFAEDVPDGNGTTPGLRWFPEPKRSPEVHLDTGDGGVGEPSLSHTINGHSIGLRLTYGAVRIVMTGDMNKASMELMAQRLTADKLQGEFVKAPHHGSHEFDNEALMSTKPVVAAVSSGDESSRYEYMHPRATLMAAMGRSTRSGSGLVFATELAAFFAYRNRCHTADELADWFSLHKDETFTGAQLRTMFNRARPKDGEPQGFAGFERTNFGIIHLRTDGERVLVFTHSGKARLNEAYRFRVTKGPSGKRTVTFQEESIV
jgi:hypothetical protein